MAPEKIDRLKELLTPALAHVQHLKDEGWSQLDSALEVLHTIPALLGDLEAECTARLAAETERDASHEQVQDMILDSGQVCACGYDKPTDVCLGHWPAHKKMLDALADKDAEIARLTTVVDAARILEAGLGAKGVDVGKPRLILYRALTDLDQFRAALQDTP